MSQSNLRVRFSTDAASCLLPAQLPTIHDVLEYTSDCVVLLDHDWRFTFLNTNAARILAQGRDLRGAELHEVFASERGSKEWKQTQAAAKAAQETRFEFYASHLKMWFEVDIHPMPTGLQIYFRDVSARREAEEALVKREETLRLALQAVGDAAWDWDLRLGWVIIEGPQVRSFGYEMARFDGSAETMRTFIHEEDLEITAKTLTKHLAGRTKSFGQKFRVRTSSGEWRWTLCRGRVIEREPDTQWALRMVGTSVDIQKLADAATTSTAATRVRARPGN